MSETSSAEVATGEEILDSGWTAMVPGSRRTEFESVVIDEDGESYLVSVLVSAQPLAEEAAAVARRAAEEGDSPLIAVSRNRAQYPLVESGSPYVAAGDQLKNLGSMALAGKPQK